MTSKKAAYNTAYNKANTVVLNIRLNKRTDKDIIETLDDVNNKSGLIKALLRHYKDMQDNGYAFKLFKEG